MTANQLEAIAERIRRRHNSHEDEMKLLEHVNALRSAARNMVEHLCSGGCEAECPAIEELRACVDQ